MDQHRIAGIGNLLADEILWRARIHPARAVGSLTAAEESRLLRASRDAIRAALRDGGVHALTIIPLPAPGRHLPARSRADADRARSTGGQAGGARPSNCWCP